MGEHISNKIVSCYCQYWLLPIFCCYLPCFVVGFLHSFTYYSICFYFVISFPPPGMKLKKETLNNEDKTIRLKTQYDVLLTLLLPSSLFLSVFLIIVLLLVVIIIVIFPPFWFVSLLSVLTSFSPLSGSLSSWLISFRFFVFGSSFSSPGMDFKGKPEKMWTQTAHPQKTVSAWKSVPHTAQAKTPQTLLQKCTRNGPIFNTFISATDPPLFLGVDTCRDPGEGQLWVGVWVGFLVGFSHFWPKLTKSWPRIDPKSTPCKACVRSVLFMRGDGLWLT